MYCIFISPTKKRQWQNSQDAEKHAKKQVCLYVMVMIHSKKFRIFSYPFFSFFCLPAKE